MHCNDGFPARGHLRALYRLRLPSGAGPLKVADGFRGALSGEVDLQACVDGDKLVVSGNGVGIV